MIQGKIAQKSVRNSERKMTTGYDISIFQKSGRIYSNFGHEKWICYDFDILKIWAEYKKENMLTNKNKKIIMNLQIKNEVIY